MIYTDLTKRAMKLCFEAHRDQTDKGGLPYVFHPFHLAEQMQDEESCAVALLHDVVEDSAHTAEDLRAMGFPASVVDAVALMSHDPATSYLDYVERLRANRLARQVKLADLRHNSDLSRLGCVTDRDLARVHKYRYARALLGERLDLLPTEQEYAALPDVIEGDQAIFPREGLVFTREGREICRISSRVTDGWVRMEMTTDLIGGEPRRFSCCYEQEETVCLGMRRNLFAEDGDFAFATLEMIDWDVWRLNRHGYVLVQGARAVFLDAAHQDSPAAVLQLDSSIDTPGPTPSRYDRVVLRSCEGLAEKDLLMLLLLGAVWLH